MADRVLAIAEHADLAALITDTLVSKGSALVNVSRPIEGLALIRSALELAERTGFVRTAGRAYTNITFFLATRDPREALAYAHKGLAYARRMGLRSDVVAILENGAFAALRVGEWSWADQLPAAIADEGSPENRAFLLEGAVMYAALRGETSDAQAAQLEEIASASDDGQVQSTLTTAAGFRALAASDPRAAHAAWLRTSALNIGFVGFGLALAGRAAVWAGDRALLADTLAMLAATGLHGPAVEADRHSLAAALLALDGRSAESLAAYRDVIEEWQDLGLVWDQAMTRLEMATVLDATDPDVAEAARAARETFVRLLARPLVDRLDRVLAGAAVPQPAPAASGAARSTADAQA